MNRLNKILIFCLFINLATSIELFADSNRYLGVSVSSNTPYAGVVIDRVFANSPACGLFDQRINDWIALEPGDVIAEINGVSVVSPEHFVYLIQGAPPVVEVVVGDARYQVWRKAYAFIGTRAEIDFYLSRTTAPRANQEQRLRHTRSAERRSLQMLENIEAMNNDPVYNKLSSSE